MDFTEVVAETAEKADKTSRKVKTTVPAKKEWLKVFAELKKMQESLEEQHGMMKSVSQKLWAEIELDTGYHKEPMEYSEDKKLITIYE